jgi:phosphoglucomutase
VAHIGTLAHQYSDLADKLGRPCYTRIDTPCTAEQKAAFKKLTPESVVATELAGEAITDKLLNAPGNKEPIGGLKVVTANGWFAARPSGTEDLYKLYAESFKSQAHLDVVVAEAKQLVAKALS